MQIFPNIEYPTLLFASFPVLCVCVTFPPFYAIIGCKRDFCHMRAMPLIVLILLIAAALRFHNIDTQSLWNDEGSSYVQATRTFAEIARNAAADIHPPGYYWALNVWYQLTGSSELALRSFSALASVLTVAFAYGIGLRLYQGQPGYGRVTGLVAAALTAANTFSIFYAQEARMYAALALWGAASMWALAGLLHRQNRANAVLLGVFNALGLWTQYAFPLVMLAQGVVALLWLSSHSERRRALTSYVLANVLALVLFTPLLPTAWRQVTTWPNTGVGTPFPQALGTVMNWLAFGITHAQTNTTWMAVMLILALFGLGTRGARGGLAVRLLPIVWVVVPVGIFVGAGLFREGNIKFLLPSQVGLALAVGQGVASLWWLARVTDGHSAYTAPTIRSDAIRRDDHQRLIIAQRFARGAASLALLGVFGYVLWAVPPLYTQPEYQRNDYRAIVSDITPLVDANDVIILNAPGQIEVFEYYYDGVVTPARVPLRLNDTAEQIRVATENILEAATTRPQNRSTPADTTDIFLVLWGDQERDPEGAVERTLDEQAFEISNQWYGDVRLARYVTEPDWFLVEHNYPNRMLFGEDIVLRGYALTADEMQPGDVLHVRLFWQAQEPVDERYKVTLQLLDENGQLVEQRDAEPGGGQAPTDTWQRLRRVADNHALVIPPNTDAANLTLIVALYNATQPEQRLPVTDIGGTTADHLTLTTISVTHPEGNQ